MAHFSKLLKESKVVGTVDTKLEQVYTTYNGHLLNQRDFGLKRTLPRKQSARSPWIRLKSLDTAYRQTDYRSAAAEASLVQMWRQMEVGVKTARKNHAAPTLAPEPRPIRIEFSCSIPSWILCALRETISNNSWKINRTIVHHLATAPTYLNFSQDQQDSPTVSVDLYEYAQGNPDQIRRDMEEFLQQVTEKETVSQEDDMILPMTHPNLGLSYGHFDQLHNERLTEGIAGRVLDQADVKSSRQTVSIAGMVGTLQRSSHMDLPSTSFEADVNGYHNLEQGKGTFRIESAHMDPYHLPTEFQFQGFNAPQDQPVRWLDPANSPRALGPNRLKLVVREGQHSDALRVNPRTKIGSLHWVGNPPPKRQGTIVLDFLNSITSRNLPSPSPSSSNSPQQPAQNNLPKNRFAQMQNDQLLKVLKGLVGKPPSSDQS
ncbi:hypothetical protein VP01_770g4 [Puccinia sorghi]|uniref:Uncharacterized protein n=1 Tax=Puccinia sorghi TaxID=27349 RepID=A0A0L6UCD8_9BASI|nr:hypothetical protein VP01_770g4 [Puccinia sorghi]